MWNNMTSWGCGYGGFGMFGLFHLMGWVLLVVGTVALVRWSLHYGRHKGASGDDRALAILRERFARGEIDKTEFDTRKRDLS
jgi:putative membrane protein